MSTMVEILERIIETRGAGCRDGLCNELLRATDWSGGPIHSSFKTWEHFSGHRHYPVPATRTKRRAFLCVSGLATASSESTANYA